MRRDILEKLRDYFSDILKKTEAEESFLNELTKELENPQLKDEPLFWTNNVDKATLERHGYDTTDVTNDALIEIAGIMGDLYADSRYSADLEEACNQLAIPKAQ